MEKCDMKCQILLIGDSGIGKTCMLRRFADDKFDPNCILTGIGVDYKARILEISGKSVLTQVWDTAGQERFNTITKNFYHRADAVMLVYDITDVRSFENISKWMYNIDENAKDNIVKMLIGNKWDLKDKRVISRDRGEEMAREYGISYHETSAKTNTNIDVAFDNIIREIIVKKSQTPTGMHNDIIDPTQKQEDYVQNVLKLCCQL
ncbi:hypothetical protein CAEBREN_06692 [Caenorhabditis brenneri]|uniref:Uncharacterized protein n=1 Tax=Caenorhabditis brenneri TaxID=135651 RepID=G0NN41_CAEBE|nr:hypothetical protein CAEBREN_06692 [Caenorhabditis brenneri]